eukprot:3703075-Pleurochrysis_carterae.AAC.1
MASLISTRIRKESRSASLALRCASQIFQILTLYTGVLLALSKMQGGFISESGAALSAFTKMWVFNFVIVMLGSVRDSPARRQISLTQTPLRAHASTPGRPH